MTSVNKNSNPNHEAATLKPNFPMADVLKRPTWRFLPSTTQHQSAGCLCRSWLTAPLLAWLALLGELNRQITITSKQRRRSSCCSDWTVPGGVTSCSVVLSVSSFSTTSPAKSSSKGVLPERGTIPSQGRFLSFGIFEESMFLHQWVDALVRISRGPNICPSVCASRPLLACAWVTLARWVRRYCRVSR